MPAVTPKKKGNSQGNKGLKLLAGMKNVRLYAIAARMTENTRRLIVNLPESVFIF